MANMGEIVEAVRAEVGKYVVGEFSDIDDFLCDLHLSSDDLTAIALALEKRLGVTLNRREYRSVSNVESLANALYGRSL